MNPDNYSGLVESISNFEVFWLGVGFPLGWLWIKENDVADSRIVGIINSRGWSMPIFKLPFDIVRSLMSCSLGSRSRILTISFFRFLRKGKNFSKNAWLNFSLIFTLLGFEAISFSTSSGALVFTALASPMAFIWHISVPVAWLRFSRLTNGLSNSWLKSTEYFWVPTPRAD